jgi:serine/threonine protein kinase
VCRLLHTGIRVWRREEGKEEGKDVLLIHHLHQPFYIQFVRLVALVLLSSEMGGGLSLPRKFIKKPKCLASIGPDINKYAVGDVIGMGSYGSVRVAKIKSTGKVIALKEMKLSEDEAEAQKTVSMFIVEFQALKSLRAHPNLPKLHVSFYDKKHLYMGLDYAKGGDLRYHLDHGYYFLAEHVSYIISSIGSALNFIHSHKMLHRDVKPENIVLTSTGRPILTDYGVSYSDIGAVVPVCSSSSGTQQYLAPEALTPDHRHSFHADFWSLGVVMYELLFAERPFPTHCHKSMIYFSVNHYRIMWDRIENGDDQLKSLSKISSSSASALHIDWEKLAECTEAERQHLMRYPKHDTVLPADKSLPVELQVEIPPYTPTAEPVTSDCRALILGLLDVRVPLRLGVGCKYAPFANHRFFAAHGHHFDDQGLMAATAPFVPDVDSVDTFLKGKFAEANYVRTASKSVPGRDSGVWSRDFEKKLRSFVYTAPVDSGSNDRFKFLNISSHAAIHTTGDVMADRTVIVNSEDGATTRRYYQ